MRHVPAERFPGIRDLCAQFDIDITSDLVPVRPAAHYMIGGVFAGLDGRSNLPRLFACGEVACTGLHGANRLGSNSLLEGLVLGHGAGDAAGRAAAAEANRTLHTRLKVRHDHGQHEKIDVGDVTNALRAVAWRSLGIERSRFGLEEAVHMMEFWGRYVMNAEFDSPAGWELQNMLQVGRLLGGLALLREESRGVHYRTDFPERDDATWQCRLAIQRGREPERRAVARDGTPRPGT